MENILYIFLSLLIGIGTSFIWFCLILFFDYLFNKTKIKWIKRFITTFASIPLLVVIFFTVGFIPLNIDIPTILISLIIIIVTVIVCVAVVYLRNSRRSMFGKDLILWGVDGVLMEISQRLMMQSLLYGMLSIFKVPYIEIVSVISTAVVWCIALILQNIIQKKSFDKEFLKEIIASLVFSIGIGWTYQITGLIILPMIGHFLERILSNILLRKKFHDQPNCVNDK